MGARVELWQRGCTAIFAERTGTNNGEELASIPFRVISGSHCFIRRVPRLSCLLAIMFLMASLAFASSAIAADPPEIAVEAGATEIFIGESVDYFVVIRNVKNPSPPDMSALRETFDIAANGDESQNQSATYIINGRVTQQSSFGHRFRFRLTPKRTGKLEIPGPSATVDGKTLTARALPLHVTAPEEQDLVLPEIKLSRQKVYPTQPFEVTLRVLVHPLPDDADRDPLSPLRRPPHLEVNWVDLPTGLTGEDKQRWLEKLLTGSGNGFALNDVAMRSSSFFDGPRAAVLDLAHGREVRPGLDGKPVNYFVYELNRKLTPEKSGVWPLGPAIVKGTFVEGLDGRSYLGRRIVVIAPAVSVEVRDVPEPRPKTFCGGIGTYEVAASASPTTLRVGDPLTLTLDIARGPGSGSLDLVSAPDLAAIPAISADFDIVDKHPTGRNDGEVKHFTYALRPKRAGVSIPPVAVTVFDPDAEAFTNLTTDAVPLTVSEASRVGAGDLVGSLGGSGSAEIKSREQGIYQNVTDPADLRDQNVNVLALAEAAAGTWLAVGCLLAAVTARRRKSGDVAWQRRQQARRSATRRLAEVHSVLGAGNSADALRAVRAALAGLIADLRNIVAEGLTAAEVDAILAQSAVPSEERAAVRRLLDAVESAEYGSEATTDATGMISEAERLVPVLVRHLERSK